MLGGNEKEVNFVWITQLEHTKGLNNEVKQAQRGQSRPMGPPARSWGPMLGPMGPKLPVLIYFSEIGANIIIPSQMEV